MERRAQKARLVAMEHRRSIHLPMECIVCILRFLPPLSRLYPCALVCQTWHDAAYHPSLWRDPTCTLSSVRATQRCSAVVRGLTAAARALPPLRSFAVEAPLIAMDYGAAGRILVTLAKSVFVVDPFSLRRTVVVDAAAGELFVRAVWNAADWIVLAKTDHNKISGSELMVIDDYGFVLLRKRFKVVVCQNGHFADTAAPLT